MIGIHMDLPSLALKFVRENIQCKRNVLYAVMVEMLLTVNC